MSRIALVVVILSSLLAGCIGTGGPLPHPLYFLDAEVETAQVWRLETDGVSKTQVTQEAGGVEAFAVSPVDGSLAVVSGNRLYLMDGEGGDRRLVADGTLVDPNIEDAVFRSMVEAPIFSPDGSTLAYAFDGLHLVDLDSGEDRHVLTNLGNLLGESYVFAREVYYPGPWSPDGSMLLIVMGYVEGSTLAVMEPGADPPFRRLRTDGPICCTFSWSDDGRSVLAGNPYFLGSIPGLWSHDAATGEQTALVGGVEGYGPHDYVGWPHQLASGELRFFHVRLESFSPEEGIPLRMSGGRADGSGLEPMRPESFSIRQALWAPDGSLAVILGRSGDGEVQLLLASADGSPLIVLIDDAQDVRDLTWGP